ncbi:hypothetical protein G6F57_018709 [Rhizopus arrhizus]|nr:hypothetical protein G6F57_018709 [Rhizopus arrhizus]
MREARDPGIAAGKVAPPAMLRRQHQFDAVAGGVGELQEIAHVALLGILAPPGRDVVAAALEHGAGTLQFVGRIHFERGGVVARIAFEIAEGVVAGVGLEIRRPVFLAGKLQSQHRGRVAHRSVQITGAQPDVPDVM